MNTYPTYACKFNVISLATSLSFKNIVSHPISRFYCAASCEGDRSKPSNIDHQNDRGKFQSPQDPPFLLMLALVFGPVNILARSRQGQKEQRDDVQG
mmetsp:Transcript_11414/g.15816  ORF Transcript_11414/g.15816 Transcript_11414/m.15816 type:complete len:97 (+) Transcript_11414:181-471(+)|eukprot:CAMPEP_0185736578 /NCGR_PEP_ID=MMETSP1171-20130828/28281_1 /TAXON_ID=374046 /ORGANISM="Helicotheca tamensis, Strain CCMP826" /LENGTH=96 /DNA_ID=CAMNT_0028407245 /DNA_START=149 /DNA_END=439 /DNA_ORIENTATION=-